jgi:hypothetical protein
MNVQRSSVDLYWLPLGGCEDCVTGERCVCTERSRNNDLA